MLFIADGGEEAARRVIAAIGGEFEELAAAAGVTPTISYGVASADAGRVHEIIDRADKAMYAAKRSGRDAIVVAD